MPSTENLTTAQTLGALFRELRDQGFAQDQAFYLVQTYVEGDVAANGGAFSVGRDSLARA